MSWFEQQYRNTQTNQDGKVEGRGLGAFLWQQFVDEDKLNQEGQKTANQQTANRLGEDLDDLGLSSDATTLDVEGAVIRRGRERKKEEGETAFERTMQPQRELIASQEKSAAQQLQLTREQMAQSDKRYYADRADARDAKALEFEYMKMRDRKEDQRYNERMEQLDRKDRKMAMQGIVAGLASLGAAFAI